MKHSPLLRSGRLEDAETCGRICHEAFKSISQRHGFFRDSGGPEEAIGRANVMLSRRDIFSIVAELEGEVVGSNFLWEEAQVAGVGPITVSPEVQDGSIGRRLMEAVLDRAQSRGMAGVRLVQAAYDSRSLSLYAKLGFVVREPLALMQGAVLGLEVSGHAVRPATTNDVEPCCELCTAVHGHDRRVSVTTGVEMNSALVVEHGGQITGYASLVGFFGHAVGESNDDLKALIRAVPAFAGPGLLIPMRNADLFRWCLEQGLQVVQTMTLMTRGLYNEPGAAYLPSVLF